jgi:Tfp pilus assembly protein PilN
MRGASKVSAELGAGPEASGGSGAFVVLGVLAACVAGVAGVVTTTNQIKQRQADLASVTAREHALAGQAALLKPFADFDSMASARVQTVRDLADQRFDWEQVLRDLGRAVPADVTLKSLSGDVSTDAGGGASGGVRGSISAPAITLDGCAPGQTQVARLMARLHDIDGVTRVSLSKSDMTAAAAQAAGQSSGAASGSAASGSVASQRNAAPCGTGKRPQFEVVMFFEHSKAAVSAPGAAPTAAAATPTPAAGAATPTATPAGGSTTAATPSTTPQGGITP